MDKVFSQWLFDVSKYVATAMILSNALTDRVTGWLYWTASAILLAFIFFLGVYFFKKAEKKEKEEKNNVKQM